MERLGKKKYFFLLLVLSFFGIFLMLKSVQKGGFYFLFSFFVCAVSLLCASASFITIDERNGWEGGHHV